MQNEIVKKETEYAVESSNLAESLGEEMQGLNITFDRIKVPSGGGLAYEVPGDNPEEPELEKEFEAVILYHHPMLSYYKENTMAQTKHQTAHQLMASQELIETQAK